MLHLDETHPQVKSEFLKGNFVVHKSSREYSALAIDQAHEHANAVIKGEGGAIGVRNSYKTRIWITSKGNRQRKSAQKLAEFHERQFE